MRQRKGDNLFNDTKPPSRDPLRIHVHHERLLWREIQMGILIDDCIWRQTELFHDSDEMVGQPAVYAQRFPIFCAKHDISGQIQFLGVQEHGQVSRPSPPNVQSSQNVTVHALRSPDISNMRILVVTKNWSVETKSQVNSYLMLHTGRRFDQDQSCIAPRLENSVLSNSRSRWVASSGFLVDNVAVGVIGSQFHPESIARSAFSFTQGNLDDALFRIGCSVDDGPVLFANLAFSE